MAGSRLIMRNVVGGSGRTSMRLEPELWDALREIGEREGRDVNQLVCEAEATRSGGRTSAVRAFVLEYFRVVANEGLGRSARMDRMLFGSGRAPCPQPGALTPIPHETPPCGYVR